MFSLGVKDKEAAKRLRTAEIARTDALLDEARATLAAATAPDCDAAPEPAPALTEAEQEAAEFQRRAEEARMERWRARAPDRDAARALLPEKTERLPREVRAWRDLLRTEQQSRDLEVAKLKAQLERFENGGQDAAPAPRQAPRKGTSLTFEKMLADYVAERTNLAPRGVASMQTHVRNVGELICSASLSPSRPVAESGRRRPPSSQG